MKSLHRRKRPVADPAAARSGPTSLELLEADVVRASGGKVSDASIPCAFSFHPHTLTRTPLAITAESTGDFTNAESATAPIHNLLEWVFGVVMSYELSINWAWFTPMAGDKPGEQVWARFLGLESGEISVDDLNARYGDSPGGVTVAFVDHPETRLATKQKIEESIAGFGEGVSRATAPSHMWWIRRPRQLDSSMVCHAQFARTMRQKYCAARAFRPVPVSLYTTPASDDPSISSPLSLPLPPPRSHPIHIAVQLHSVLDPKSGTGDPSTILANLPQDFTEYLESMGLTLTHLLTTLRRHTRSQIHVHLFADPPLQPGDTSSPLWKLEQHPLLREFIIKDGSGHGAGASSSAGSQQLPEGIVLRSHFLLPRLHAFHHWVLSDIFVSGWNAQSLLASTLHEGIVLVPALPHFELIGGSAPRYFDLPVCGPSTVRYQLRRRAQEATDEASQPSQMKQQRAFDKFFGVAPPVAAGDPVAAAEVAGTPAAAATAAATPVFVIPPGAGSDTPLGAGLLPSRFPLPNRRVVRRRNAEALVLSSFFSESSSKDHTESSSGVVHPNALLMRHCQAIPEPLVAIDRANGPEMFLHASSQPIKEATVPDPAQPAATK